MKLPRISKAALFALLLCVPFAWAGVEDYSTTPASNTALFPESMLPSAVNDSARQVQADLRTWYNDAQWIEYGDGDGAATVTYASSTSFTVAGVNVTSVYHTGRRVKAVGSGTGTIYGTISSSSFSTNTTVNVTWDSGSLSNESLTIYIGITSATNTSFPPTASGIAAASEAEVETGTEAGKYVSPDTLRDADVTLAGVLALTNRVAFDDWQVIASVNGTTDLTAATSNLVAISGTNTITGFGSVAAGGWFIIRATGAWTVTYSSSIIGQHGLTSGTYTAAAGDLFLAASQGGGTWNLAPLTVPLAGTAAMEAGTSNDFVVTPGRQHRHPSAAKAIAFFSGTASGPITPSWDFNVDDITEVAAGRFAVNFTDDFSDTNYVCTGMVSGTTADNSFLMEDEAGTKTAGSFPLRVSRTDGAAVDPVSVYVVCYGDQ